MHPELEQYIKGVLPHIAEIPQERKRLLEEVASFVSSKREGGRAAELNFICTHNSRRSQMGQLWAAAAANYFGVDQVRAYSGGTEATAFNPRAVAAIERAGFSVERAPVRYEDPKVADDTPAETSAYDERCRQIATEMLYLFSRVT